MAEDVAMGEGMVALVAALVVLVEQAVVVEVLVERAVR